MAAVPRIDDGSQSKTSPWKIVAFSSVTQWGEQAKYAPLSEKRDGNPASAPLHPVFAYKGEIKSSTAVMSSSLWKSNKPMSMIHLLCKQLAKVLSLSLTFSGCTYVLLSFGRNENIYTMLKMIQNRSMLESKVGCKRPSSYLPDVLWMD